VATSGVRDDKNAQAAAFAKTQSDLIDNSRAIQAANAGPSADSTVALLVGLIMLP
jgi:hypothetical protein